MTPRSPLRNVALTLAALVAVGVAVALLIPKPIPPDPPPPDPTPTTAKIQELQEQVKLRDAEISKLVIELQTRPTIAKIQELQQEIAARDEEIKRLVTELKQRLPKPLPPQPRQDELVTGAISGTRGDLTSCLNEWSRREPGDARLAFKMTVSAEGVGHSVLPLPDTAGDDRLGPSLRECVGAVLARVPFKPGPENLDVQVSVQWNAERKALDVSAGVVGRRRPP